MRKQMNNFLKTQNRNALYLIKPKLTKQSEREGERVGEEKREGGREEKEEEKTTTIVFDVLAVL